MHLTQGSGHPVAEKAPERMLVRALVVSALAAAVVALLASCSGGTDSAVLATTGNYHPMNFVDDSGEIDGLERELGDELCRRAKLECEWVIHDWETLIPSLENEQFDAIIAGMSITAERETVIDFTEPYYPPAPSVYLALEGAGDEAVSGRLGTADNTIYSDYFEGLGIEFEAFGPDGTGLDALLDGEVDAILVDHAYAVEKVVELEGQLAIVGPEVPLDMGLGIGVRDGHKLKGQFDGAIESMKADGSLNALITKWLGANAATF